VERAMPRYLVERTYAAGHCLGAIDSATQLAANALQGVTWIHSYVSLLAPDHTRTYCVVDGPSPEAVRLAARANGQPVDRISEVCVLNPYAYR
jgi:hypothetical protein